MSEYNEFADQLNIETPEQVDLRFPIAGVGSRFLAILADTILQIVAYLLVILLFVLIVSSSPALGGPNKSGGSTGGKWVVAILILFHFLLYWGYFALFEAFWNGQTPGKRLLKIRVIKDSGRQITLFEALARNLLRVIDLLPGMYLVGVISMVCNREQKRLGDLVAGTIVVHESATEQPLLANRSRTFTAEVFRQPRVEFAAQPAAAEGLPADAVARLRVEDLQVIDAFFGRVLDLEMGTRAQIAARLAARMSAKMQAPMPEGTNPERWLEAIAYAMRSQSRR